MKNRIWIAAMCMIILSLAGCGPKEAKESKPVSVEDSSKENKEQDKKSKEEVQRKKETEEQEKQKEKAEKAKNSIILDQYDQLKAGMSYEEAVKLIGSKGIVDSKSGDRKTGNIHVFWYNPEDVNKTAQAQFRDNKLLCKWSGGIRPKSNVTVTKEQVDSVKKGMTYEQVKKILGGEGELVFESTNLINPGKEFNSMSYDYKDKNGKVYHIDIYDGKFAPNPFR